jgi:tetratricopeptide (TPR) repeat protein
VPPGPPAPVVDGDVTGQELDRAVLRELTTLRAEAAQDAAKHLVMAARLLDDDPDAAHQHAMAARRCGPRVGVIREAVGLAAYASGRWAEALAELRAARRISGISEHWPVMADCERALGRPERALQMAADPETSRLDRAGVVEMRIVTAGARADLGQFEAAVVTLHTPELNEPAITPWSARLRFAYAAALEAVRRDADARLWYRRAAEVDPEGVSGAAQRLLELDGVVFVDSEEVDPT